ncbi:MAG: sigma-54-dependent Fis family transcriptional regulator [Syntrophomonadaceae bacterium]|jgi:transcriptional regulator of acetoin/glycerol metabolism|nr:sigma-54-dependent Fis family transcriptional regulator [Syntrophomonadaceae bacterium]
MRRKPRNDRNQAWKNFIEEGYVDPIVVSPEVADSWGRSVSAGVHPFETEVPVLTESELKYRREKHHDLLEIAIPLMEDLHRLNSGAGFVIILSDIDGYIIHMVGDTDFEEARRLSLISGANWHENMIGTNAIGTAIASSEPVKIDAAQHYLRRNHMLTCAAAPIFNPQGELIAVLDASGHTLKSNPHTLGMVVAAARAIEDQLLLRNARDQLVVAYKRVTTAMESAPEGMIALDEKGVITQINHMAARLLGLNPSKCIGRTADDIIRSSGVRFIDWKKYQYPVEKLITTKLVEEAPPATFVVRTVVDNRGSFKGAVATIRNVIGSVDTKLQRKESDLFTFADILGQSRSMIEAKHLARVTAETNSTVLLLGETGTGKELFAQAIHRASDRAKDPFVVINCGALPENLVESELFGYEEGAFTGAVKGGKPGKFEQADQGTIFLDEIGEMPMNLQVDLLRVLESKQVTRVGGTKPIPVDVRVVAATNRNLRQEVEAGNFRADLFYRLNVISVHIPSLREREGDIPELANHFLTLIGFQHGKKLSGFESDAMALMERYSWPGNVRELRNVIERMVILARGSVITVQDLPEEIVNTRGEIMDSSPDTSDEKPTLLLRDVERMTIIEALEVCEGNISEAARQLGIGRNTLYRKMKEYEIGEW